MWSNGDTAAVLGPVLTAGATGIAVLVRLGVRSVLARIEATETRLCTELAANTALTASITHRQAHQAAQIAYLQGCLHVGFGATGSDDDLPPGNVGTDTT